MSSSSIRELGFWGALLGAVAACTNERPFALPTDAATKTVVLVSTCPGQPRRVEAYPVDDVRVVVACDAPTAYLLEYTRSLEELCLSRGTLLEYGADASGAQRLPSPDLARQGVFTGDDVRWEPVDADQIAVLGARFVPPLDHRECASSGRCVEADACGCFVECAAPTPFEVAPPTAPAACPTGWRDVPLSASGPTTCRAFEDDLVCEEGSIAVPGRGCVEVGSRCERGRRWPVESADIHVDAAVAASGTGARTSPVRTIEEAFALAPVGGRVALASGRHALPEEIGAQDVTLVGACARGPDRVELASAERLVVGDELGLRDLRLTFVGEVVVQPAGRLQFEHALVDGDDLTVNGTLTATQSSIAASTLIRGEGAASASAFSRGLAIRTAGARLVADGSSFAGDPTALSLAAGTVVLRNVHVRSSSIALAVVNGGSIEVDGAQLVGRSTIRTNTAKLRRVYARSDDVGLTIGDCESGETPSVVVHDGVFEGARAHALGLYCVEAGVVERVVTFGDAGLTIGRSHVNVQDVTSVGSRTEGISVYDESTAVLARVHVRDVARHGVRVSQYDRLPLGGGVEVRDLFVERAGLSGLCVRDLRRVSIAGAMIGPSSGSGVLVSPHFESDGVLRIQNATIHDITPGTDPIAGTCDEPLHDRCSGTGINLDRDPTYEVVPEIVLQNVDIERATAHGLYISGPVQLSAEAVRIRRAATAVRGVSSELDPRELVRGVLYEGNGVDIDLAQ